MTEQPRKDAEAVIDCLLRSEPAWWAAVADASDERERIKLVYDELGATAALSSEEDAEKSGVRHEVALLLAVPQPAFGGRTGIETLRWGDSLLVAALLTACFVSQRVDRHEQLIRDIQLAVAQLERGELVSSEQVRERSAARRARRSRD